MMTKSHHFYLLANSPWPLVVSLNSFNLLFSLLMMFKFYNFNFFLMNLANVMMSAFIWWFLYSGEFNLEGKNSSNLESGLKFSMLLFISSEVWFFFSFFWSYFHFSLAPCMETGMSWPPYLIKSFDCLNVPLINTLLLLTSGITITISHYYLISDKKNITTLSLAATIMLGTLFTIYQAMEYMSSFFNISDSNFGTTFFMLTGFHGIHVIIGSIFLLIILIRSLNLIFSKKECLSFELASWYWHFVDVVWIFLYFFLYYLNN